MKVNNIFKFIILSVLFCIISCKRDKIEEQQTKVKITKEKNDSNCPKYLLKNKNNNLNISILLDLSDRINEKKYPNSTMEYYQRDLGYINTITNSFLEHIQKKKLVLMNDNIQVYFEPQPKDITINKKSKDLMTSFTKNLTKNLITNTKERYESLPKEIYDLARKNKAYLGSDTWRFFKDKVKRYCIKKCNRNILVILTDGYMFHVDTKLKENNKTSYITPKTLRALKLNNSKWENTIKEKELGFIPATKDLTDLEVLVIGIVNHDKKQNPYGKEVIHKYWSNWFDAMGVKKYEIYGAELPSNIQSTIQKFILN